MIATREPIPSFKPPFRRNQVAETQWSVDFSAKAATMPEASGLLPGNSPIIMSHGQNRLQFEADLYTFLCEMSAGITACMFHPDTLIHRANALENLSICLLRKRDRIYVDKVFYRHAENFALCGDAEGFLQTFGRFRKQALTLLLHSYPGMRDRDNFKYLFPEI